MSNIVKEMLRDYYSLEDSVRMDLDKATTHLINAGVFLEEDLVILKLTMEGQTTRVIGRALGSSHMSVVRKLDNIARAIAGYLGEEYQDSKILKEVELRLGRPLTSEEILFCQKVIEIGHPLRKGLNIFNFKVGEDGRITIDENKTER